MKDKRLNVFSGLVAVSAITAVTLAFSSGCKSHATKENSNVPAPVIQPAAAQPVSIQPASVQPVKATPASLVPAPVSTPAIPDAKAESATYSVQKGDTFSKIAKKHGVGMKELADYNKMSLQAPLKIGVTLKIPPK